VTTNVFPQPGIVLESGASDAGALFCPRSGGPTMTRFRDLQPWLTGRGPCLQVADFGPATHPLRPWAQTCPWAARIAAVERACAPRFPRAHPRGRPPVSTRVWLALEWLKQALACSDEPSCRRLRTALAVMSAGGIVAVQVDGAQEHGVLPDVLAHVRRRLEAPLRAALRAIQAAPAREDGLVSPAPVGVDTFPRAPGSPRGHDAATLDQAPKKSARCSCRSRRRAPPEAQRSRGTDSPARTTSRSVCAAAVASAGGWGTCA
jgi:hypothetical protein